MVFQNYNCFDFNLNINDFKNHLVFQTSLKENLENNNKVDLPFIFMKKCIVYTLQIYQINCGN